MPKSFIPDIKRELEFFAINPFTREKLTIDTLIEFVVFENGEVTLDGGSITTPNFV